MRQPLYVFQYDASPDRLGILHGDLVFYPAPGSAVASIADWLQHSDPVEALHQVIDRSTGEPSGLATLDAEGPLLAPLDRQEVWAAGVTYLRSKVARMEESEGGGSFYDRVYEADRPELFLKATPSRVVGPGGDVRIRVDARWNVPEPEIALVISAAGRLVGYTLGNDMSSRDIEGENPLYLPQAKVYRQSCALGPVILVEEDPGPHREFLLRLSIQRGGRTVFEGETSTGRMKRRFEELIAYLMRDNLFPEGAFMLTGTGIVPPDDFTLEPGDRVEIESPEIGVLRNQVVQG